MPALPSLDIVAQQSVYTLALAAAYALFATGFLIIFGVLDVLNLAYAFVFMISANLAIWMTVKGSSITVAIIVTILAGCALGLATDVLGYRSILRHRSLIGGINFGPVVSTLAIGQIILAVAQNWFGTRLQSFSFDQFPTKFYNLGGDVTITLVQAVIIASTVILLLLLKFLLGRTTFGTSMRALAQNRTMAESLGINTSMVVSGVWVLSSALAAVAGVYIAIITRGVDTTIGSSYELKGFIIVVLGGLGSVGGAMLSAIVLAVLETGTALYLGSQYSDMITLGAVIVLLAIRPNGLLGARKRTV